MGSLPDGGEQWLVRTLNPNDASIFLPPRMREYLQLASDQPPYHLNGRPKQIQIIGHERSYLTSSYPGTWLPIDC